VATSTRRLGALLNRRSEQPAGAAVYGTARLGRKTKDLVKKLGPGDIAVINHTNIDRIAAEELISTGVRAVLNASQSSNGRYPNAGPLLLARAGVLLIDAPGAELFDRIKDGDPLTIEGGTVIREGREVLSGHVLGAEELAAQLDRQREEIYDALADFAENTVTHLRQEGELLAGRIDFPATRTVFRDRHALIVVRGTTHRKDLQALRAYIRDMRPLLVGVDGGADAILEAGLRPDLILGDMDSASDAALRSGAELVVHAYPDGRAPGRQRLLDLELDHMVVPAGGTSQDVAMLMAFEKGAALIVSVGAHFNLIEFLDKNRGGMSSTFLTRLRILDALACLVSASRVVNGTAITLPEGEVYRDGRGLRMEMVA
jgi:uncharacterized membrane-anchored protein